MDIIGWLELSWCRKWIWLVDWSCRDRDKAIVRGGMVYGLCKWWPFHHTIFGPHTLNRLITISPWTWHKLCEWPHESQMDMVTSSDGYGYFVLESFLPLGCSGWEGSSLGLECIVWWSVVHGVIRGVERAILDIKGFLAAAPLEDCLVHFGYLEYVLGIGLHFSPEHITYSVLHGAKECHVRW